LVGNGVAEEVWNQDLTHGFFESGGGGFSNRFPMPEYQKSAVSAFLKKLEKTNPEQLKHFDPRGVRFIFFLASIHIQLTFN
jgi:tripeptidyl-peptidase-1